MGIVRTTWQKREANFELRHFCTARLHGMMLYCSKEYIRKLTHVIRIFQREIRELFGVAK
jgi:hypothetical protein